LETRKTRRTRNLLGSVSVWNSWTENHTQQEGPETVTRDAVRAQENCEDQKNEPYPRWEFIYDLIYGPVKHNSHTFKKQTARLLLFVETALVGLRHIAVGHLDDFLKTPQMIAVDLGYENSN
jgi:hypothetical protein